MIGLPLGTRVWLAAGVTDMRNYAEHRIMLSSSWAGPVKACSARTLRGIEGAALSA